MCVYPSAAFYAAELSPAPQHFPSRQAPPLPRRLRAEPKIDGRLSYARFDKPRFALKAQVCAESSASATTLACASLLANFARVFQKALCSLSLSSLLPWLAPSCENAALQQRHQARERMTHLAAATSEQLIGIALVIFARLATQLNTATVLYFTEQRSLCTCLSLSSMAGNIPS